MSNPDPQSADSVEAFKKNAYDRFNTLVESCVASADNASDESLQARAQAAKAIESHLATGAQQAQQTYAVYKNNATGILVTLRNVDPDSVEGYTHCKTFDSFGDSLRYINSRLGELVAIARDNSESVLRRAERDSKIRSLVKDFLDETSLEQK